jgi:hypothetical protein
MLNADRGHTGVYSRDCRWLSRTCARTCQVATESRAERTTLYVRKYGVELLGGVRTLHCQARMWECTDSASEEGAVAESQRLKKWKLRNVRLQVQE